MRAPLLLLAGILFGAASPSAAQHAVSQVDLRDGGSIFCVVIEQSERVRVVRGTDTLDLPASQVERVRSVHGHFVDGRFMRLDPNETRLFFGPTARTLPRGDAYVGVFELFLPFLAYGVTDRITLAGGAPLLFGEDMPLIVYLAPKVQVVRGDRVTASLGSLSFFTDEGNAGLVYGVTTLESGDGMTSVTTGGGLAYAEGEMADGALLMLGGDVRVSRSLKLMTENYVLTSEEGGLFSFGVRFIGERLSADIGLAVPSGAGVALPLVNFVYSF